MTPFTTNNAGFSLVETLVAITILLLVIIGPMTISSSASKSTSFASEQTVAFFLAQEGIELIQKSRDDALLFNIADDNGDFSTINFWSDFTDTSGVWSDCFAAAGCAIEISDQAQGTAAQSAVYVIDQCSLLSDCRLYLNTSAATKRSRYTHNPVASTATPYYRVVKLRETASGQVQVQSEVLWRTGSLQQQQSVKVESYLFDIYGQ